MPDRWQYGNSSIATVQIKLISQREYTVLSPGSSSVKLFMKPQTPTTTGRAVTSSWRETVGCVTQERRTICQLTKFEGYWIRPVYIYPSRCVCALLISILLWSSWLLRLFVFYSMTTPPNWFLERIFAKSKPEERTWAKLVNLNTVHWYCDGPEPTPAAINYKKRTRQRKSVNLHF